MGGWVGGQVDGEVESATPCVGNGACIDCFNNLSVHPMQIINEHKYKVLKPKHCYTISANQHIMNVVSNEQTNATGECNKNKP